MSPPLTSELMAGGSARCGRCAEILPDETLTYCPTCGVPFSRVPPTDSYVRLDERHFQRDLRLKRLHSVGLSVFLFAACFALYAFLGAWNQGLSIPSLASQREIIFHFYDVPGYPTLDRALKREAVNVAIQAFEDHFGMTLKNYRVADDHLPPLIEGFFRGEPPTRFSDWEKLIYPKFQKSWEHDTSGPLDVVLTNIPILVDGPNADIETRHLSAAKIISGLGHPSLVTVSTFRMLTELPEYRSSKFRILSREEQARHLGEYLLAHELGHALIGLSDFVIEKPDVKLRAPASVEAADYSQCLMHTDEAGGFSAWENIRRRTLGRASSCEAYASALEAFRDRSESLMLLKIGRRADAEAVHKRAMQEARQSLQPWVADTWAAEHGYFLSLLQRWRNHLLVVESKYD